MKVLGLNILVGLLYYLGGKAALFIALPPSNASPIWPAAGVALAFALAYGKRLLPGIFIAAVLVNIRNPLDASSLQSLLRTLSTPIVISGGALLQVVLGVCLIRRFITSLDLIMPRDIARFMIVTILTSMTSAIIGISFLFYKGFVPIQDVFLSGLTWWTGDAIGSVLFAPPILTWVLRRKIWYRRSMALSLILGISIILTTALFAFGIESQKKELAAKFESASSFFAEELQNKIDEFQMGLHSIFGLYGASDNVTRKEFASFSKNLIERLPEMKSLAWVPQVMHANREEWVQRAKQEGIKNFHIKEVGPDGKLRPAQVRERYFPLFYLEPKPGNEVAFGIDNGSEPKRLATSLQARDENGVRVTDPIILGQDKETGLQSVLLIRPIYKKDASFETVAQRQSNLYGFVTAAVRIRDLSRITAAGIPLMKHMSYKITDQGAPGNKLLFHNETKEVEYYPKLMERRTVSIGGRTWSIEFRPLVSFQANTYDWTLWFLILGALIFTCLMNTFLLFLSGQTLMVSHLVDERTAELKKQKTNLEKTNLELDSFVYIASHDLRAPLRSINAFAGFIEEDYGDKMDEESKENLKSIRSSSVQMERLIEDLLTLTRTSRTANVYKDVSFNEVVVKIQERLKLMMKEANVDLVISKQLPTFPCDEVKMTEVFANLISNAIKFSRKSHCNGESSLSSQELFPRVEIAYDLNGENHEFSVSDNGIGIAPEHHKKVFENFTRLNANAHFPGTGLGLSIVKRIIEDHGGSVWVESELGQGATFRFTIPVHLPVQG